MLVFEEILWQHLPNGEITRLKKKQINGLLIKQFLAAEDIRTLIDYYRQIENKVTFEPGVLTYPRVFTKLFNNYILQPETYLQYKKELNFFYEDMKKMAAAKRLAENLNRLFSYLIGKDDPIISAFNLRESISPLSFRELLPGSGEFQIHYEDLTFIFHATIFEKLHIDFFDMTRMSYFIVLQAPEEGGELECFEFPADHQSQRIINKFTVFDNTHGMVNLEQLPNEKKAIIVPEAGDLFMFHSADLWHRVNLVNGNRSRITVGGFLFISDKRHEIISFS